MNLNFSQLTGTITQDDGRVVAVGWSGCGDGKRNPEMQGVVDVGPLPRGVYKVGGWGDHPPLGQNSTPLTQISGESYGRDSFYIHGTSLDHPGQESHGCVVVPHGMRLMIQAILPEGSTLTVVR